MCEVESIINGRLLTNVSDDKNDVEALISNHLLLIRSQPLRLQVPLVNMMCMQEEDGSKFNTLQICSGPDGLVNIFLFFKGARKLERRSCAAGIVPLLIIPGK